MIPEPPLFWAILVVLILLTAALTARRRGRRRALAAEYYGNEPARFDGGYESEDDRTAEFFSAAAEDARRESRRHDTRTLAELGSECSACKTDHPGMCELLEQYERDLEEEDVLTGTIVAVEDIPEIGPQTETLFIPKSAASFTWEVEREWHRKTDGSWQAPWALLDRLPEDDWLRELLEPTRELVAA